MEETNKKLAGKLFPKLVEVASKKDFISYSEVAKFLNIDLGKLEDRYGTLRQVMGCVNEMTISEDYLLTSVITYKKEFGKDYETGDGYFTLAKEVGLLKSTDDKKKFWYNQLKLCYKKHSKDVE